MRAVTIVMTSMGLDFSVGSGMLLLISGLYTTALLLLGVFMFFRPKLTPWHSHLEKQTLTNETPLTDEEKKKELRTPLEDGIVFQ